MPEHYTYSMAMHDSKRALASVGDYSKRLAAAIMEAAADIKNGKFMTPSLMLAALATLPHIIAHIHA